MSLTRQVPRNILSHNLCYRKIISYDLQAQVLEILIWKMHFVDNTPPGFLSERWTSSEYFKRNYCIWQIIGVTGGKLVRVER